MVWTPVAVNCPPQAASGSAESLFRLASVVRGWLSAVPVGLSMLVAVLSATMWQMGLWSGPSLKVSLLLFHGAPLTICLCVGYALMAAIGQKRAAAILACVGYLTAHALALLMASFVLDPETIRSHQLHHPLPTYLFSSGVYFFFLGLTLMVAPQPLTIRTRVATCLAGLLLQTFIRITVFLRTGLVSSVTSVLLTRSVTFVAGMLTASMGQRSLMCGGKLATELEALAQGEGKCAGHRAGARTPLPNLRAAPPRAPNPRWRTL